MKNITYAITEDKQIFFGEYNRLCEELDGKSYVTASSVEELIRTLITSAIHCSGDEPLSPDDPCFGVDAYWYISAAKYLMDLCDVDATVTFEEI